MKGWIRLAIVLSVFWLIGCGVVLLVELSQLPQSRDCAADRPAFAAFFQSTKISAVHVRHPQLGIVAFPSSMTRPEIEDALRRNLPKFYEPTNAPIEWDVPVDKQTDYYRSPLMALDSCVLPFSQQLPFLQQCLQSDAAHVG
jgi:hypothetical protein